MIRKIISWENKKCKEIPPAERTAHIFSRYERDAAEKTGRFPAASARQHIHFGARREAERGKGGGSASEVPAAGRFAYLDRLSARS